MVNEVIEPDSRYKDYPSTKPEGFLAFHESTIAPIAYEIPYGSKVLDVGCNDGALMELLKEKRDCEVFGIDVSETAIAIAKAKGLEVQVASAESLPFADGTFDAVTLVETLSHLVNTETCLKEIKRVLKKDGVLLGCVPHKNMERQIWSDKRLHRRNYDEVELQNDLEKVFEAVHMRVLTGAQFAVVWAQSMIGDQPAEMLFKCGRAGTPAWEKEQLADKKPRVWFGYTQLGGTIYYRMLGFAEKMDKLGLIQAAYERGPWESIGERATRWQQQLAVKVQCGTHCESGFHIGNRIVMNHLEQILRAAHVSIWQVVQNRYALTFLRCAKDLANGPWYKASGEKKYFITEIDDNFFDIPAYNVASNPYHPNSELEWIIMEQIKLSDALVCSTQYLLDKIKAIYPEKKCFLIPNSIDFDVWDNLKPTGDIPKKEPGQIRIGYTGCSNHRQDLELVREPLSAILKEYPHAQFLFTPQPQEDGLFKGWEGVPNMGVVSKWTPIDEYPNFLAGWDLDIGIAPLKDNDFNRAKSNLRWLEYSALKIPTVASRVYPFKNSIRDGKDGFICNSKQEWYDALKSLVEDAEKRKSVGQTAYERVKTDFNMENVSRKYFIALTEVLADDKR